MSFNAELKNYLQCLQPEIRGDWAFCLVETGFWRPDVLMKFIEDEGTTVIVPLSASNDLDVQFVATRITLKVVSDLKSVGLTAAISKELSALGIACNVVAGVYHDHIFVPKPDAEMALNCLKGLAERASAV